jgi:5'-nucleotidase/UDP-sugar diphosphatase
MTTLILTLLACNGEPEDSSPVDDGKLRVTVLHTNDWQSHMLGWGPNAEYSPETTGDDLSVGGLARTATLVAEIRGAATHPVVLYDGGDWMAGALFQLLATSHAAELQMFQAMGYDAVTLGNHEFDWGPQVLGEMITQGDALGVTTPILAANTWPNVDDAGDDALEAHFDSGRIQPTLIQELDNGLRIGLIGLLGDEAQSITPGVKPSSFSPMAEAAALAVEELQAQDVDLIVALTHAGITDDPKTSPDEVLAMEVPGIDVIVGGHSHTPLHEPRTSNGTVIVQAGAYTRYLGQLDLAFDGETWEVEAYTLHELDDSVAGDVDVTSAVDGFVSALESGPLEELGYGFSEPMLSVPGDVAVTACAESGLGDYITDAFRQQATAMDPEHPIDVAFESQGVIRDDFIAGETGIEGFSDVFRVMPLGFGSDEVPGYALVDFYVTASELADTCEVAASISPDYGCNYFVELSGMRCEVDMGKSSFNRVVKVELLQGDEYVELDTSSANEDLYHVAVDSYVASLLSILEGLTYGAIIITPKDIDGAVVTDLSTLVFDKDPSTEEVEELKLWEALIGYAETLEDVDGDGVPDVPESYLKSAGRLQGFE